VSDRYFKSREDTVLSLGGSEEVYSVTSLSRKPICVALFLICVSGLIVPGVDAKRPGGYASEWVVMLYADGDTGPDDAIQDAVIENLDEVMSVSLPNNVKVIVQVDITETWTHIGGDWQPADNSNARRYRLISGEAALLDNTLGEVNMGDPNTLSSFVTWAIQAYPSNRYALVLMDHGMGWWGVCEDASANDDRLDMHDLGTAFDSISTSTGKTIDLVGFDACLMQYIGVAYELMYHADVMVASESRGYCNPDEDDEGMWPYDSIMAELAANPLMDAEALGSIIVQEYGEFYETVTWDDPECSDTTISAIRMSEVGRMSDWINYFAMGLQDLLPSYHSDLRNCREITQSFVVYSRTPFIDLYDFCDKIEESEYIPMTRTLYRAFSLIRYSIDYELVIASWHNVGGLLPVDNAHGIGIYLPYGGYHYDAAYGDIDFSLNGAPEWWDFLVAFNTP